MSIPGTRDFHHGLLAMSADRRPEPEGRARSPEEEALLTPATVRQADRESLLPVG